MSKDTATQLWHAYKAAADDDDKTALMTRLHDIAILRGTHVQELRQAVLSASTALSRRDTEEAGRALLGALASFVQHDEIEKIQSPE